MTLHEWIPVFGFVRLDSCAKCGVLATAPMRDGSRLLARDRTRALQEACPDTCEETGELLAILEVQSS